MSSAQPGNRPFHHPGWTRKGNFIGNLVMTALKPRFAGKSHARRYKLARRLIDEAFDRYRNAKDVPPLGCGEAGCFGCCLHQKEVDTSDYEVERILNRVENEKRLGRVVARAEALSAKQGGGACPLLSTDGCCTVYDIRPLSCAAYHSLDRNTCHSGPKAEIPFAETLFVEATLIAGLGLVAVDEETNDIAAPRIRLFGELARARPCQARRKEGGLMTAAQPMIDFGGRHHAWVA